MSLLTTLAKRRISVKYQPFKTNLSPPFSGFITVSLKFREMDKIFKMFLIFIGQGPKKKGGGAEQKQKSVMWLQRNAEG